MTIHQTAARRAQLGSLATSFEFIYASRSEAKRDESGAFRTKEESQRELRVTCNFVADCTKVLLAMRY